MKIDKKKGVDGVKMHKFLVSVADSTEGGLVMVHLIDLIGM